MPTRPIRTSLIESHITQLMGSLGIVSPIDPLELRTHFKQGRYTEMVRFIKRGMRLDIAIRIGYVKKGGPKGTPAWINIPIPFPLFGSSEFSNMRLTMFLRISYLTVVPFESVIVMMAHELAHVVLHAIHHPLRWVEEAVDLTAMILGYADLYVLGCEYIESDKGSSSNPVAMPRIVRGLLKLFSVEGERHELGYLSPAEVTYAATLIRQRCPD